MNGHFITFEGIDGCGKTTQRGLTARWLRERGFEVVETFEPGDTPLGAQIRSLLLSGEHIPAPETELLLFLADRTQHLREVVEPALKRGAIVLCDRYSDSTRAYQLAGRALAKVASDAGVLATMLQLAELGFTPEITLWFDLPVEEAGRRMRGRVAGGEVATRLDDEQRSFHDLVREGFAAIYEAEPGRVHRVDANAPVEAIQLQVQGLLQAVIH
ncbi:MAG: dTMP kinase [Mariprofundaceae bacterium]|nr:dTMP kinase [Mariprofundaceae bacterium]